MYDLDVNFFFTAQFAPDENGINISSTTFCSIFSVVSMCKDPTRKERLGISGMDVPTLKKMTLTITAVSLPLTAGACWAAYFVLPKYMNLGDPNSSLTFQQELYLLTYPYMGLLGLCGVSLLLFYYLFNRYFSLFLSWIFFQNYSDGLIYFIRFGFLLIGSFKFGLV